jgi:hypothetical protein
MHSIEHSSLYQERLPLTGKVGSGYVYMVLALEPLANSVSPWVNESILPPATPSANSPRHIVGETRPLLKYTEEVC